MQDQLSDFAAEKLAEYLRTLQYAVGMNAAAVPPVVKTSAFIATKTGVAFKHGTIFEKTIETAQGPVDMLAEVTELMNAARSRLPARRLTRGFEPGREYAPPVLDLCSRAAVKRVIATIHLSRTEEGGRSQPLPLKTFGCPVLFENVPELQAHAYDCRLLLTEHGEPLPPGRTVDEIALLFLSADEVLPHMRPGVRFSLWEGKTIGSGTVFRVEDTPWLLERRA